MSTFRHVVVRGRVQGIGYRAWTERVALSHGLKGWVRNRRDGSVEAVFIGEDDAVEAMRPIADKEDSLGDEPEGVPAREMIADMLLEAKRPQQALAEYQTDLKLNPNRFNGLYGAAQAAEAAGKQLKAAQYYAELVKVCAGSNSERPELSRAKGLVAEK